MYMYECLLRGNAHSQVGMARIKLLVLIVIIKSLFVSSLYMCVHVCRVRVLVDFTCGACASHKV